MKFGDEAGTQDQKKKKKDLNTPDLTLSSREQQPVPGELWSLWRTLSVTKTKTKSKPSSATNEINSISHTTSLTDEEVDQFQGVIFTSFIILLQIVSGFQPKTME